MNKKIVIGCPIYSRGWILPEWFKAIENQAFPLDDIGFVFVTAPNDTETKDVLYDWKAKHPEVTVFQTIDVEERHEAHGPTSRIWTREKYYKMVDLRNHLLAAVSCLEPERFLSLDSDILLENPQTLQRLYSLSSAMDVVSPLSYMYPKGGKYPSVMSWIDFPGGPAKRMLDRYPFGTTFKADVVMAVKMMSKPVYENVRYRWHRQGEDLGFCAEAARLKFNLFCASDIYCPHIMYEYMLEDYKIKGDDRSPFKNLGAL